MTKGIYSCSSTTSLPLARGITINYIASYSCRGKAEVRLSSCGSVMHWGKPMAKPFMTVGAQESKENGIQRGKATRANQWAMGRQESRVLEQHSPSIATFSSSRHAWMLLPGLATFSTIWKALTFDVSHFNCSMSRWNGSVSEQRPSGPMFLLQYAFVSFLLSSQHHLSSLPGSHIHPFKSPSSSTAENDFREPPQCFLCKETPC